MTTLAGTTQEAAIPAATRAPYVVVRALVSLLLLTAAGLKGYQLATSPTPDTSLLNTRWLLILAVEYELVLGLWLFSGWRSDVARPVALISFAAFAGVAGYKAVSGEANCGCFGQFEVNPWVTLVLDLVIVAALFACRPKPTKTRTDTVHPSTRPVALLALAALLGGPAGYLMANYTPAALADDGQVFGDSEFVVLEPETWVGKRFPLLSYIDIGDQLAEGKWIVVLYRHDCPHCMEEIPKYEQLARDTANDPSAPRIALIEMPPYAEPNKIPIHSDTHCVQDKLRDTIEWFVETPAIQTLDYGLITDTSPSNNRTH